MIKLNLGCGNDIQPDYINIDERKTHCGVVIADVRNLPYMPNSVDEIRAIDVYEHISHRESQKLLNHWVEILKPGGLLYIQGTSLIALCKYAMSSEHSDKQLADSIARIFGGQNYPGNFHATAIHPSLISSYLRKAGITGVIETHDGNFGNRTNIRVRAWK